MKKPTLDIKQMKYLQELGLDTSNASAYWYRIVQHRTSDDKPCIRVISDWKRTFSLNIACCTGHTIESIFAFTLDDVVELLPAIVDDYRLYIDKGLILWTVGYVDAVNEEIYEDFRERELIDAAYEMLCWVIENGYLKV